MIFTRAADFPKSDQYLRQALPKVLNVPRIVNAMREFGGLSRTAFADSLRPGKPPSLVPSWIPIASAPPALFWIVPPDATNRIFLKESLFVDFEKRSGADFLTIGHVSAAKGTPGAREFSGTFDRRGMLDTLSGGPPQPGTNMRSLGFHREKDMFMLGAAALGALVIWSLWHNQGKKDSGAAATRFAAHAYRSIPF